MDNYEKYEKLREEALRIGDTTLLLIAQLCINEGKTVKLMESMESRIALLERKANACVVEMDIEY